MQRCTSKRAIDRHRKSAASPSGGDYLLCLYVAGNSSRSRLAILRARELCANELKGRCTLEVIDIYQDPLRARDDQILATPTLVRVIPRPVRRLIGAPGKSSRLFIGLGFDALGASGT